MGPGFRQDDSVFVSTSLISTRCSRLLPRIRTWITARRNDRQPADIMLPARGVVGARRLVRQAAMGHPHQGAAVAVDQVDLDQARSGRDLVVSVPAKTVG